MFCQKCGANVSEGATFCPSCGSMVNAADTNTAPAGQPEPAQPAPAQPAPAQPAPAQPAPAQPAPAQPAAPYQAPNPQYAPPQGPHSGFIAEMFRTACSAKEFLIICILATVGPVLSLFSGVTGVIASALPILMVVSFWLMFAAAQTGNPNGYKTPVKILSVLSVIEYVLLWVAVGLFALAAIIFLIGGSAMENVLQSYTYGYYDLGIGTAIGVVLFIVFLIVAGVCAVLNIFCVDKMRKCAKTFELTVESGQVQLSGLKSAETALLVFGILEGVAALFAIPDVVSFLAGGCSAATLIMLYIWLKNIRTKTGAM